MTEPVGPADFRRLLLAGTPFIDVRAEIEFGKGAIPGAVNLPILNTGERAEVGTTYKQRGRDQAVRLGHTLVQGSVRDERIAAWCDFARAHPGTHVYCWRGGMRSNLTAQWMAEAGTPVPVIEGGYKALRRFLMTVTENVAVTADLVVIGGQTGAAKTPLVQSLETGIDLEGHAHHRGSSFGRHATPPPSQVDFEHRLALDLLHRGEASPGRPLFLEDEGHRIGAVSVPLPFFQAMKAAPLVILEMPLDFRIERIYQEYVVDLHREYMALDPASAGQRSRQHLLDSLSRIRNRLGMERYGELHRILNDALLGGEKELHLLWIRRLLEEYYDPMYHYQIEKAAARVVFRGDYDAVTAWCEGQAAVSA